ncbi:MAG: AAA family ATPase [Myxococcota bacterium]
MSAYLKFFELEQSPFEGKAQSQVVLGTRALREAFGTIRSVLDEGASHLCVSGNAGLGKTSLARALPKLLGDAARVANVLDTGVEWPACRELIARQWGLDAGRLSRAELIEARADRRLVLVIDQAERASEDFLDHLDVLLSYRTETDTPVVQSVLLANLETREGGTPFPLLCWLDRTQTLQLEFAPLPRDGVASYIAKHLQRAGWRGEALFSEDAGFAIHGYAGGVPGKISALCERLLAEAASLERADIDADFVHAFRDPEPTDTTGAAAEPEALRESEPDVALTATPPASEDTTTPHAPSPDETEAPGEMDAACVPSPEPERDALAPLVPALSDEELAAFATSASPRSRRPIALVAIAATVAGLAFLVFGGEDASDTTSPYAVAKTKGATLSDAPAIRPTTTPSLEPAVPLASPAKGFVVADALAQLPSEVLADAIAAAEALVPVVESEPEPARLARVEPPVTQAKPEKNEPSVTIGASEASDPDAGNGESPLVGANETAAPAEAQTSNPERSDSIPASLEPLPAVPDEERFW